jgi:pyruvate carboxylase
MALMMVAQGLTKEQVLDPTNDMAFPESVVEMLRGDLGQPPGGWPENIVTKVLTSEPFSTERPGKHLPAEDLEKTREELSAELSGFVVDNEDLAGYLMYPRVFLDYMGRHRQYGPVRILPTPVFFYGMVPGQEISIEIDPGKTLEIRYQTMGETDDTGEVRVFFELNGQPRAIRVSDRAVKAATRAKPKAEEGNPHHIGAPMPGAVASIAVTAGQVVKAGDLLLTIEAMKMEAGIHADRTATIKAIHVSAGNQIDAKDLLIELG